MAYTTQNLSKTVVEVIVALIITIAIAIPFIDSTIENTKEVHNNEFGHFAILTDSESTTITVDEDGVYYKDGVVVTIPSQVYAIMFDKGYLRFSTSAHEFNWQDESGSHHSSTLPQTYEISNNILRATIGENVIEVPYMWCGVADNDGDYRVLATSGSVKRVYVNDYSQIYGVMKHDSDIMSIHGTEVSYLPPNFTNPRVVIEGDLVLESNVYPLYGVDITYTTDNSDLVITVNVNGEDESFSNGDYLVPYTVFGQSSNDHTISIMLTIVPIIFIAGIIVTLVYQFIAKRD